MKTRLGLFCIAVGLSACDPAMFYSIPGARTVRGDGVRYVVPIADGIEARFHAMIFTIHGSTEVQVVNTSGSPVEFRPAPTVLVAGNGTRLPTECKLPDEPRVSIAAGQTLTVRCGFQARLRRFSYEPEFATLTLLQPGLSINGKPLEVKASMMGS